VVEGSKQRIQAVALDLLSRHGYAGTGIKAVSEASGLPYGSIYHHFPGGKEELVVTALDEMGAAMGALLAQLLEQREPADAIDATGAASAPPPRTVHPPRRRCAPPAPGRSTP